MTVLLDLAERCEAATEPCEELDADVALATGWTHRSGKDWHRVLPWERPAYTASLDAAMTLVPNGWFLELEQHTTTWTATLADAMWFVDRRDLKDANAATPALALTAATLRARASVGTRPEGGDALGGSMRSTGDAVPKADAQPNGEI